MELLPTVHEGATVRAMEKKGIRTEKGEFNRWIKATNAVIRDIKKKIALLFDWIAEAKAELAKPQAPDLVSLLNAYYTQRRAGAYSQKGKVSNLKEMNETFNYLRANGIYSLEDLERRVSEHSAATESLKKTLDEQTARMKAIKQLYETRQKKGGSIPMNYTQAQIDRANAVSLEDFLRTQGETLIKSGREYRWKEHDSLTVRGNKWFRHSQSKGGYPIDFVMEFYGKSFPEAVQLLTGQFNIFAKAEVSTKRLLRLFFFLGIFTRTQSGTMLCLSAETEAVHRDTPMCEERQTHSDRTLSGLTSPIRSDTRETATSSLSLKHRLTCYRSSAFIRRTGR